MTAPIGLSEGAKRLLTTVWPSSATRAASFTTAETKVLGVAAPTQVATTSAIFLPQPNPYNIQPRLTGFVNQI